MVGAMKRRRERGGSPVEASVPLPSSAGAASDSPTVDFGAIHRALKPTFELLPALSPFAFLVGYASVWAFASRLGLRPADLDLGLQDYLILASGVLVVVGAMIGGSVLLGGPKVWQGICGVLLLAGAMAFMYGPTSPLGILIAVGGSAVAVVNHLSTRRRNRRPSEPKAAPNLARGLAGLLFAVLLALALQIYASWGFGQALARDLDESREPFAMSLVVATSTGTFQNGTETTCAVRIAPRVFIIGGQGHHVIVLRDIPERFTIGDCEVAP
jgi:hypothetical protein